MNESTNGKPSISKFRLTPRIIRIIHIVGIIVLIIGILDPLEGSILVAVGSIVLALSTNLSNDKHKTIFLILMIMIVVGVGAMWYISYLGGFGGTSSLSWWWGITILPYPIGWIATIILLIVRAVRKRLHKKI